MKKFFANLVGILSRSSVPSVLLGAAIAVMAFCQPVSATGIDQYTKLMIHSNNPDGDTTFIDSSLQAHSIVRNGDTHHSSSQARFGSSSISFDGSGDYLEIANDDDWNFGGQDFTIDFWVHPNSTSQAVLMEFGHDPVGTWTGDNSVSWRLEVNSVYNDEYGIYFAALDSNMDWHRYMTDTPHFGLEWTHIAFVRSDNTLRIFENGDEVLEQAIDFYIRDNATKSLKIGAVTGNERWYYLEGYLDEIRISNGFARWTDNFTPPTAPYDAKPVPEPTTMLLLASGLVGLAGLRRNLRKS